MIALIKTAIGAAAGGLFGMIFMRAGTGRVRSVLVLLCRAAVCCFLWFILRLLSNNYIAYGNKSSRHDHWFCPKSNFIAFLLFFLLIFQAASVATGIGVAAGSSYERIKLRYDIEQLKQQQQK